MPARTTRAVAVAGALVAFAAAAVSAQRVSYSGSVQFSSGTWLFGERTTSYSIYNGVSVTAGRLHLAAGIPVVIQNSTAITWIGSVPIPTGGPDHAAVREQRGRSGTGSGTRAGGSHGPRASAVSAEPVEVARPGPYTTTLGDPLFRATADLVNGPGLLRNVGVDGFVKAPVADLDTGVGSGEWDWGGGVSVTFGTGRTLLFLDVGFQVLGDLPDLELRDGILMSAAIGHGLADGRTTAIASFSAGSEVIDGVDPGRTLALVLGRRVSSALSLSLGGSLGLTESDADYSVLIGWRAQLLNRQR